MPGDERFRILVVCTANICRSPMAERMLQAAADERGLAVTVSSAGFLFDGEPAADSSVAVMRERGLDVSDHRARRVDATLLDAADLVVTMERRHAREILVDHPDVGHRVHTLGALTAALLELDATDESPAERIREVTEARTAADLLGHGPDEVADPHGRSKRAHRLTADRIAILVDALLDGLYGAADEV